MRLAWAGSYTLDRCRLLAKGSSSGAEAIGSSFNMLVGFQLGPPSICRACGMKHVEQKGVLAPGSFDAASIFGPS